MEIRYKNNSDKLTLLGIPMVLIIISVVSGNTLFILFSIAVALVITFILANYLVSYWRKKVVIYTKDKTLHIRSNGKYDIPFKSLNKVYLMNNKLYIEFIQRKKQQKIYLSDLYDHSLDQIYKKLKNKVK